MRSVLFMICVASMLIAGTIDHADIEKRLERWKPVRMPYDASGLTAHEKQTVEKLVQAAQQIEDIYWRQSDPEGLQLYKTTQDPALKRLLFINGSRYDLLDDNKPFAGDEPYPP